MSKEITYKFGDLVEFFTSDDKWVLGRITGVIVAIQTGRHLYDVCSYEEGYGHSIFNISPDKIRSWTPPTPILIEEVKLIDRPAQSRDWVITKDGNTLKVKTKCNCEMVILMRSGCKCGGK